MFKKIKQNIPIIMFIIMFSIGSLILLYPIISNYLNSKDQSKVIVKYAEATNKYDEIKNAEMIDEAVKYNSTINSYSIVDVFTNPNREESDDYVNILNIDGNGLMGYISIPKIAVKIPIYHGTSAKVLEKGVGHLEGSSFPVGGTSTHSILSAHRGLPSAKLFTDLDQLEKGDKFYVYILDQILAYEVDQILVVEPSETEALQLQEGKDYVTLVTCTPYAINTHRLLVRGTRVEYIEEVAQSIPVEKKTSNSDIIQYIGIAIAVVLLIFAIFQIRAIKKKRKLDEQELIQSEQKQGQQNIKLEQTTEVQRLEQVNNISNTAEINNNVLNNQINNINNNEYLKFVPVDVPPPPVYRPIPQQENQNSQSEMETPNMEQQKIQPVEPQQANYQQTNSVQQTQENVEQTLNNSQDEII